MGGTTFVVQQGVGRLEVIQHDGLWWPDDVGSSWLHAVGHANSAEWAIARCQHRRTAIQAGGNVGLWPRRMAARFTRVITFEPDAASRACLMRNVPKNVTVCREVLGAVAGTCAVKHRGLGSHRVVEGDDHEVITIDSLQLPHVDLVQLDIEGYEWHALAGARDTLARCHPLVQVELRGHTGKYGKTDAAVRELLAEHGYQQVSQQQGSDFVFEWHPCDQ